ncbi:hypothetical protein KAR91_08695, partial [Candidatus Pacearchaeota archaeon]|nr:hypothetical protein [Candidatus Pacearchaeota archaeon]
MSDSEEQSVKSPEDEGGELTQKQKDEKALAALSTVVSRDRDDAVSARKASGIETIWDEDEEYYQGIDDNNRAHEQFTKSQSVDGGLRSTGSSTDDDGGECTAFFNITRQFVDSGAARMGDILLPAGEWNFNLKATPIAGIESVEESEQPVNDEEGNPLPNPDGSEKPYTMGDFAKQEQEDAEETVEKAEVRIKDWLVSCKYSKESRKVIERSARIGTGVLRMFQRVSKARAVVEGKLIIDEKVIPGSKEVDPRNLFPAPDCGDNIHNGSFLLERDLMTAGQVRDLKKLPGFIAENIDKVLKEGANGKYVDGKLAPEDDPERGKKFEIWYYFGEVKREELCACGVDFDKREETEESDDADGIENVDSDNDDVVDGENDHDPIPAVIVLINNTVIKGFLNADSTGEFPYDLMPWQCRDNSPWGIGVSRQARVGQDMLNASARTLMKNAGLSSAPQLIIGYGIRPQNGSWELEKGKIWIADEDAEIDVRKAILAIEIPSMQVELANMIEMASKFVEDATGISFLLQGQQGSAPDTFGGTQIMHNNASALLRRIARIYD